MKATLSKTTLSGLFLALAVTAAPTTVLAENGSDRGDEYRMRNQQLQMKEESSQSFVRMVQDEPTAAGPQYEQEDTQPAKPTGPQYRSPIHQQRIEYGH